MRRYTPIFGTFVADERLVWQGPKHLPSDAGVAQAASSVLFDDNSITEDLQCIFKSGGAPGVHRHGLVQATERWIAVCLAKLSLQGVAIGSLLSLHHESSVASQYWAAMRSIPCR